MELENKNTLINEEELDQVSGGVAASSEDTVRVASRLADTDSITVCSNSDTKARVAQA